MAKKMDVATGEEVEVSDDEMMEALHSGQGFIKQIATLPDGTKKEVAIWGGYEMDGYDRTLNVFMNHADISTFIHIVTENTIDPEGLVDPCEAEEGTQVTVDFMDMAATLIYRRGQGKLSTELYVRDERKTCQSAIESGTGEIDLNEDGGISLDAETLQNNKFLVFALAVLGVRRYLLKEGIVKKLYDMFDESAGVVVKVSKSGNISAKIVKGMERPDLPCDVFLFGEQICRPYIDEMLGLKSSGVRKPRDPELAAKLAEADKVAKEKAEAEKKKKAEEAKKAEEERIAREKAEAEAAEAKRKQEMAEWEKKVAQLKSDRKKEEQERTEQIKKDTSDQKARLLRIKEDKTANCEKEIADLKQQIENDKRELESLGFFKFSRKKELNLAIESNTSKIKEKEDSRGDIQKEFQRNMDAAESSEASKLKALSEELEKKYAIPDSPEEIERKKKEEEYRKTHMTKTQMENESVKEAILDALSICGPATVTEIMRYDSELSGYSNQRISALLRQLVDEGKVTKSVDRKACYFELA